MAVATGSGSPASINCATGAISGGPCPVPAVSAGEIGVAIGGAIGAIGAPIGAIGGWSSAPEAPPPSGVASGACCMIWDKRCGFVRTSWSHWLEMLEAS
jgi:hypothetical protein